ncbi:MAG TPA: hypothetical protein VMZ73_04675, partial [Acidimicrobiales bacterium]|nr:hypothetical protein [Acidimicrobiales bacterium]
MSTRTVLHPLFTQLKTALADGGPGLEALGGADPVDWRDLLLTLSVIHDLHAAPLRQLDGRERLQHHPTVAHIKWRLEETLVAELVSRDEAAGWDLPERPSAAIRAIGVKGLVPEIYEWLAHDADHDEIVEYLSIEGGPDGGFDDLVAACQIGLDGTAKLELARNYWD